MTFYYLITLCRNKLKSLASFLLYNIALQCICYITYLYMGPYIESFILYTRYKYIRRNDTMMRCCRETPKLLGNDRASMNRKKMSPIFFFFSYVRISIHNTPPFVWPHEADDYANDSIVQICFLAAVFSSVLVNTCDSFCCDSYFFSSLFLSHVVSLQRTEIVYLQTRATSLLPCNTSIVYNSRQLVMYISIYTVYVYR